MQTRYGLGIVEQVSGGYLRVRLSQTGNSVRVEERNISSGKRSGLRHVSVARQANRPESLTRRTHVSPEPQSTVQEPPSRGGKPFEIPPNILRLQAIEALRFGLVPSTALKRLTIDFESLEQWTVAQLPTSERPHPGVAEVSGPFGTGKSHACAVIRHIALERGYLVANVEVDGKKVSLSDPATLWNTLSQTLRAIDLETTTPVVDLYERALRQGRAGLRTCRAENASVVDVGRANFEVVRKVFERGAIERTAHILEHHLTASPGQLVGQAKQRLKEEVALPVYEMELRSVIAKSVSDRPQSLLQALAGVALAGQHAGYAGLVITVDEFEVEYNLAPLKFERVRALIGELATYLSGQGPIRPAPVALFFAAVGQGGHAGDAHIESLLNAGTGKRFELTPMNIRHRLSLAREIHSMYVETYGLVGTFNKDVVHKVERSLRESGQLDSSGVARAFVKRYVASLDQQYGPPHG